MADINDLRVLEEEFQQVHFQVSICCVPVLVSSIILGLYTALIPLGKDL